MSASNYAFCKVCDRKALYVGEDEPSTANGPIEIIHTACLTAHDAEVAAKALEEAALSIDPTDAAHDTTPGPYLDGLMQAASDTQVFLRALAHMKRGA